MLNSEELTIKEHGLEAIREKFKTRFLIVDDGYDWDSVIPPADLPTVFHGTSAWLQEDIEKKGLTNSVDSVENIEKVFNLQPDLHKLFSYTILNSNNIGKRMKPDEYKLRKKVYCTYNHQSAEVHTHGPEILNDYLEFMRLTYKYWHRIDNKFETYIEKVINELGSIDTCEKKLLMSSLKPKSLIVHAKPTRKEFDSETTLEYGRSASEIAFLVDSKARKDLYKEIQWARDRYLSHSKGNLVSSNEMSRMWLKIQSAAGLVDNTSDFELLPIADLVQIYLRNDFRELLFHKINPESITKLEKM